MKTLVVLALVAAATTATPYPRGPDSVEEIIVLPNDFDLGRDSWFGPIPQWFNFFNFNTGIRDFIASMNPFGDISDLINKGNTTSETKVLNGTLITRNNTIYVDKDSGTVVHVSSVDIRPSEQTPDEVDVEDVTASVDGARPASKDPESTEEIDTNPSVDNSDIDTPPKESNEIPTDQKPAEEIISLSTQPTDRFVRRNYDYDYNDISNDIEVFDVDKNTIDLDNDIYVNDIMEEKIRQSGGMHQLDPDVELIDISGGRIAETYPNTQIRSIGWDLPEDLES